MFSFISYLRALFLPSSLRGYYLASQKNVGIEIQKNAVLATIVQAQGHKKVILNCIQQDIASDESIPLEGRIIDALKKVAASIGGYDGLSVSLPNNVAIFKEITIPFADIDTIKQVVPFEIEPLLPFALQDAFIEVLVTQYNNAENKVTVQAAAVKRTTVAQTRALYYEAGLKPDKFSIHLFESYAIYKEIPEYHNDKTSTLSIEVGDDFRQFMAIIDGQLRNIRIIAREAQDAHFVQDIQFNLEIFNSTLPDDKKIQRILVATAAADNKTLLDEIHGVTGLKAEELLLYKVVHNNTIKAVNGVLLTTPFIASVGAALDLTYSRSINFLQDEFAPYDNTLLIRQLITSGVLLVAVLGGLVLHTQLTQYRIKKEIRQSQQEAKQRLIKELGLTKVAPGTSLEKLLIQARASVKKQEEVWFALSSQNRYSFLNYLQELFRRVDVKALGLKLTMLSINDATSTMVLEGEVKNYAALQLLDQELSRPHGMFKEITHPQEPKFSIKIILDKGGLDECC